MNLGKAIKVCRVQRGLSQGELAALTELSTSYLSLLERDKRDPTFSTIAKIASALRVPVIILVYLADEGKLASFNTELHEKLSYTALKFINMEHKP